MKITVYPTLPVVRSFDLTGLTEKQMQFIVSSIYATENGAKRVNCSGFDYTSRWELYRTVQYAK